MLALPPPRGDQIGAIRRAINRTFALLPAANRANHLRLGRAIPLRFPQFTKWTSHEHSFRPAISTPVSLRDFDGSAKPDGSVTSGEIGREAQACVASAAPVFSASAMPFRIVSITYLS